MKNKIIYACICGLALFSCEEVNDLLTFHVSDRTTIQIEGATPGLPLNLATPDVTSNSEREYQNNNTHADLVKDVKLEQLKLTITNPSGKTFSFLKTIRIFISTTQENEIELASLENISATTGIIELIPTQQKLDTYAKASSYNLRTLVTTHETLSENITVQADLKFRVTANTY
jgi:hypothetical protein